MAATKGNSTAPDKAKQLEIEEKCLVLRRDGYSYGEIAKALQIAKSHAHKLVKQGLARSIDECKELSTHVRQMELDRLDRLQRGVMKAAISGDLQAIATVLRIMERRSAYLNMDAPKHYKVEDVDDSKVKKGLLAVYEDLKKQANNETSEDSQGKDEK